MIINNLPLSACEHKYIVAREVENLGLYYWGAWDNHEKAEQVAREVDGIVIATELVEG